MKIYNKSSKVLPVVNEIKKIHNSYTVEHPKDKPTH